MGRAIWHPKWWTKDQHESHWERVKEALKRDWEQTKTDLRGYGKDLGQGLGDTVMQAVGQEPLPPPGQPTPHVDFEQVAEPLRFGVGARWQYGAEFSEWNDTLESRLKGEWESDATHGSWNEVKGYVRRGWETVTA